MVLSSLFVCLVSSYRVLFKEGDSEIVGNPLWSRQAFSWWEIAVEVNLFGKSLEIDNQALKVLIVVLGLVTELVLEGDTEGKQQVQGG